MISASRTLLKPLHRYQGGVCHVYSKDGLVFMKRLQLSVQLSVSSALQYYFGTTNTEC